MKIMNTPVNLTFFYIKVGCKGVYITQTCYHDVTVFGVSKPSY